MPSLKDDGPGFFPNVLRTKEFQKDGVLFGSEPGGLAVSDLNGQMFWAVVDPDRHKLYVFQKHHDYFPDTAVGLGASVFTNGSFNLYTGGSKTWSVIKYAFMSAVAYIVLPTRMWYSGPDGEGWRDPRPAELKELKKKYFTGSKAQGFIYGAREGIKEEEIARPELHHFGRKDGRTFADYVIAKGDPPSSAEFIGGLFRTVEDYSPKEVSQSIGAGFWGLAPLLLDDSKLKEAGLEGALEEYAQSQRGGSDGPTQPCAGLLITLFYWGKTTEPAELLAAARVKDAVRIDGNDSILLGHGAEIVVGATMSDFKKLYNKWGFQCRAE